MEAVPEGGEERPSDGSVLHLAINGDGGVELMAAVSSGEREGERAPVESGRAAH